MAYPSQNPPPTSHPTFAEALAAARRGEETGFRYLWEAWSREVEGFLRSRDHDDPAGATNEVYLRAFRNLATFEGDERAFRAWLFAITRNLIVDGHRRAASRPLLTLVAEPSDRVHVASAESTAIAGRSAQRVAEVLGVLTDEQREVLLLRIVGGLDSIEIAEITGRKPGAVRAMQRRALHRLRRTFSDVVTDGVFDGQP